MNRLFAAAIVLGFTGCGFLSWDETFGWEWADSFQVHVQSHYENTPVRLELDRKVILDDTVTTGRIIALAAIVPVQVRNGWHHLRADIDRSVTAETTLVVKDTLFVTVNFDPESRRVIFGAQRKGFGYR